MKFPGRASDSFSQARRRFPALARPPEMGSCFRACFSILRAVRPLRLILLPLLFPFLPACAPSEKRADIVIINGSEPESLDPAIVTGQPDCRAVRCLFEGLTRLDPRTATPIPGLAEKWDISADATTYTFHLRTNAVWSTGQPITVDDVIYSWIRVLTPATACDYAGQLYFVKNAENFNTGKTNAATGKLFQPGDLGFRKIDPFTLRVELVGPTAFFLDLCAFPTLAVVPRFAVEKYGDRWLMQKPLPVNGPYLLEGWRLHDKIRYRKNPRYWDASHTRNEIVDFLSMDTPMTALNLFKTGQADIIWDKNLVPTELMDILRRSPECHTFDYLGTCFVRYNVTRKPFDDVRVRKALALVLDKKLIVEKIRKSGERIASHLTPPGMPQYRPPEGLGYDPDLARKLLAEAGYPGGKNFPAFEYLFNSNKTEEQIAVEMQAMWTRELGLQVRLRQAEWKVYLAAQSALDYEVSRSSWIGDYNDPNTFLDMFMSNNGNNRTGWKSARYDQLMRDGNSRTDAKQREKLLQEAETLLIRDEVPIAPLYFYSGINFFDATKIEGVYFNLLDEHPALAIRRKNPPGSQARR